MFAGGETECWYSIPKLSYWQAQYVHHLQCHQLLSGMCVHKFGAGTKVLSVILKLHGNTFS